MAEPQEPHDGQKAALELPGAIDVPTTASDLGGVPILTGQCPRCGRENKVSGGAGRAYCQGCGALLHFRATT